GVGGGDDEGLVLVDAAQDVHGQFLGRVETRGRLGDVRRGVAAQRRLRKARVDVVQKRGVHEARAHDADLDAASGRLGAQPEAPADDGVLGGGVGDADRHRDETGERGGVDDVPVPLLQHDRVGGVDAVHDALEVDVDRAVPVVERELLGQAADPDAGVVEDQVDVPVVGPHALVQVGDGAGVGDVQVRGRRLALAERVELVGDLLGALGVDVGDHDGVAARHQGRGDRTADAGRSSGHDRDAHERSARLIGFNVELQEL